MNMFNTEQARKLLTDAGLFFYDYGDENGEDYDLEMRQTLNMNDVWGWACADGEYVPDEKLSEVADLFWRYGWAGILYWASQQTTPPSRSEFHDINRLIDFVRHEEQLRKDIPDSNARAYKKISYTLGND